MERTATIANNSIHVEVVDTEASREQGLSGRTGLEANSGMLFAFDQDAPWGIWMKDMKFAIDIVWVDASNKVIYIVQSASPDSYPTVFTPPTPAHYVIELPAGYTAAHGVVMGSQFVL